MNERPVPVVDEHNAGFWEAADRGELDLQACGQCGHIRYPIAAVCPRCWSSEWSWQRMSGRGSVLSFVVYHRAYHPAFADLVPYNVALVRLQEGPTLVSNIVDAPSADVVCDMPVRAVFTTRVGDVVLPQFAPIDAEVPR